MEGTGRETDSEAVDVATLAEGPCYQRMKPGITHYSLRWERVHDLVAQRLESGCMGSDCCLAGTKDNLMVLPCHGHKDTWFLGKPFGMLGTPCLFGRDELVGIDLPEDILEEAEMPMPEAPGMIAVEGCTLGTCYHAEHKVTPGYMQGVGPKVPDIDFVVAEEAEQRTAHSLRMGC